MTAPDPTPPPASTDPYVAGAQQRVLTIAEKPISLIDRIEHGLDDATKAVLDLAFVAPELTASALDRILSTFAPEHAEVIRTIAEDLAWVTDLRTDDPLFVLRRYYGYDVGFPGDRIRLCEQLAEEKETDAVRAAQLVASLLVRRVDVVEQVAGQVG